MCRLNKGVKNGHHLHANDRVKHAAAATARELSDQDEIEIDDEEIDIEHLAI